MMVLLFGDIPFYQYKKEHEGCCPNDNIGRILSYFINRIERNFRGLEKKGEVEIPKS
jgi:hypothetical protein